MSVVVVMAPHRDTSLIQIDYWLTGIGIREGRVEDRTSALEGEAT